MRKLLEHTMRIVGVAFILAASTALPAYAAKDLDIRNDTNSFLFVSGTGGNVGIGTTVPVAKLSVVGTGTTTGKAFEIDDSLYAPKVTVLDNGNVGVGSTTPAAQLQVGVNPTIPSGSSPATAIKGNLVVDGKIYGDGTGITGIPGTITGLTPGYLPKSSTSTTIVDSNIYSNGSNLGIGTTAPASTLDLVGAGTTSATSNLNLRNANKSALVTVLDNGNVGIGTTAPQAMLSIGSGTPTGTQSGSSWGLYVDAGHDVSLNGSINLNGPTYIAGAYLLMPLGYSEHTNNENKLGLDDNTLVLNTNALRHSNFLHGSQTNPTLFINSATDPASNSTQWISFTHNQTNGVITTGVGSLILSPAGNVGIGTTSPAALLQVGNNPSITTGSAPAAAIKGNLMVDGKIYGDGTGITGIPGTITGLNAGYLSRANTATSIVDAGIYQNGTNVGIGSTAPGFKLDVVGDVKISTNLSVANNLYTNSVRPYNSTTISVGGQQGVNLLSDDIVRLAVVKTSGNVGIGTTAPSAKLHVVGSGTTTGNAFEIDDSLYAPKVTVLDNGNVGIGTTVPSVKLDVAGTLALSSMGMAYLNLYGAPQSAFVANSHSAIYETSAGGTYPFNAYGNLIIQPRTNTGTPRNLFFAAGETTPVVRMTVLSTGNVGIGTTAPVAMLHVGATPPSGTADLSSNSALIKGNLEVDGKIYGDGSTITGITGTITGLNAGYLARANTSTSIVDSGIYQSGSNIGVGTTVPQAQLEIGTATTMVSGATPALAVKSDVVVDGNVYGNEYHLGANAVIKYNASTSSIDFVIN